MSNAADRRSFRFWRTKRQRDKSNRVLRAYLTAKARLGRWDARYCAYNRVDTSVTDPVKRFLTRAYAAGLVPTSTRGGKHAPGSLHYSGHAGDVGLRRELIGTAKGTRRMVRFQRAEYRRAPKTGAVEIIGPDNSRNVLRSRKTALAEGTALEQAHDNHVHGGF